MKAHAWHVALTMALPLLLAAADDQPTKGPDKADESAPAILKAKPLVIDAKDDPLLKLLKERYNAVVVEVQHLQASLNHGLATSTNYFEAHQRLLKSGLELSDKPADKVALLSGHLELTKRTEQLFEAKYKSGALGGQDLQQARYHRIDAEIQLLRAEREREKAKGK